LEGRKREEVYQLLSHFLQSPIGDEMNSEDSEQKRPAEVTRELLDCNVCYVLKRVAFFLV